jgi:sulfoxide reductase catalytic subunit YedY
VTVAGGREGDAVTPSHSAIFPGVRVGGRWLNLVWTLPIAVLLLVAAFGIATLVRTLPEVQEFVARYPGTVVPAAAQGFPAWVGWQHFLNFLFLVPMARAGLQVWAGRPRAYWRRPATPGSDWLRMQEAYPRTDGWSMRDDAVGLPSGIGLPGKRLSTGLARWWHLGISLLWVLNGAVFYVLLFTTGQWTRIVPTSLEVFPHALSALVQYLSLDFPVQDSWVAYNSLQLLAYFVTVFVAAPLAVLTGILHSPAIAKRLKTTNSRFANGEVVRSVHLLVLAYFVVFVILHVTLVLLTGALENFNHITLSTSGTGWAGLALMAVQVLVVGVIWAVSSPVTLRFPAAVHAVGARLLGPINKLF